jgi:hypothetical protein
MKKACTSLGTVQAGKLPTLCQLARDEDSETKHSGPEEKKSGGLRYGRVASASGDTRSDVPVGQLSFVEIHEVVEQQSGLELEVYRLVDVATIIENGDEVAEQEVDLAKVIESIAEIEEVSTNSEVHFCEAAVCCAVGINQRRRGIGDGEGTTAVACVTDDIVENDVIGDRAGVSCEWSYRKAQKENEGREILAQWMEFLSGKLEQTMSYNQGCIMS